MKYLTMSAAIATFSVFTAPAFATQQTVILSVPGMICASCPYIVESAISAVDGVDEVSADFETRSATVIFDDAVTSPAEIRKATAAIGYQSELIDADGGL